VIGRKDLYAAALEIEWDMFTRITLNLFSAAWLEGASALLALNDAEDGVR
jgi:hypothetical protein